MYRAVGKKVIVKVLKEKKGSRVIHVPRMFREEANIGKVVSVGGEVEFVREGDYVFLPSDQGIRLGKVEEGLIVYVEDELFAKVEVEE